MSPSPGEKLRAALGAAPPGAQIRLLPGEYEGPFEIARAVTLVGTGPSTTLWCSRTATVVVHAAGVALRDVQIEAVGPNRTALRNEAPGAPRLDGVTLIGLTEHVRAAPRDRPRRRRRAALAALAVAVACVGLAAHAYRDGIAASGSPRVERDDRAPVTPADAAGAGPRPRIVERAEVGGGSTAGRRVARATPKPDRPQPLPPAARPPAPREDEVSSPRERIAAGILARLQENGMPGVGVEVTDALGVVLTGLVATAAEGDRAIALALRHPGVTSVISRVRVPNG